MINFQSVRLRLHAWIAAFLMVLGMASYAEASTTNADRRSA